MDRSNGWKSHAVNAGPAVVAGDSPSPHDPQETERTAELLTSLAGKHSVVCRNTI